MSAKKARAVCLLIRSVFMNNEQELTDEEREELMNDMLYEEYGNYDMTEDEKELYDIAMDAYAEGFVCACWGG